MKIGIYTYNILPGKWGGVEQYSYRLIEALVKYTSENITVFTNSKLALEYECLLKYGNIKIITIPSYHIYFNIAMSNKYARKLKFDQLFHILLDTQITKLFLSIFDIRKLIYKHNVDVLHIPLQTLPFYNWKIPTLISLHDLQQCHLPQFFTHSEIEARNMSFKKSAEASTRIIVSFTHVKEDIINFYNIPSNKIDVNPLGISKFESMLKFPDTIQKLGIHTKYILYPAQTWEHKNHINLLKALEYINKKYDDKLFLVCTGKKNSFYNEIEKIIKELDIMSQVFFTGYISDEELGALYEHTSLVVIPTLYEAGSFPLLEAMAHKTPVICAKTTSLPETIGDDKYVFDPNSIEDIGEHIYEMLNSPEMIDENIKNSEKQIKKFQWNISIFSFINSYKKAIEDFNKQHGML